MLQDRKSRLAEVRSMMSSVEGGNGVATRIGADMRSARERLGWDLPEIAAHLRIRLPYLEAIEDGRIADLPGNAYAVGFLRAYAQALGLDPDEVARRFREEASHINQKTALDFPAPMPERGVPAGAVVLLGVVLAIGAYAGWYKMSGTGRPDSEPVQPVPARLMPLAEAPAPLARPGSSPAVETTKPLAAREDNAFAPPAFAPPAFAPPAFSPSSAAAAIPAAALPAAAPPADGTRIVLRARADAWVQVRDKQGVVLLNRVLRNGETWPVPAKSQLLLTTGNAGGTELLVDGLATASLGADGAVRRDLPLDPDLIRDGKLAIASPAPVTAPATTPATAPAARPPARLQ